VFTELAPTAFNNIGWKYYLVFIFPSLLAVGWLIKFFPETKGRTLEEIGEYFGDEVAIYITDFTEKEREKLDATLADIDNLESTRKSEVENKDIAAATQV
jgi:hypothetical protein